MAIHHGLLKDVARFAKTVMRRTQVRPCLDWVEKTYPEFDDSVDFNAVRGAMIEFLVLRRREAEKKGQTAYSRLAAAVRDWSQDEPAVKDDVEAANLVGQLGLALLRKLTYQEYLRTAHWKRVRERAMARAKGKCAACFGGEAIDVHHKHYQTLGCEQDEDVEPLCRPCHAARHRKEQA